MGVYEALDATDGNFFFSTRMCSATCEKVSFFARSESGWIRLA